jgi:hypothetical protein
VNARVFPWLGDASAVLDLIVDGEQVDGALTTPCPQTPLRFVCDRTGAYGGNSAWVRAGVSGGAVGSPSTPFPTLSAAFAALVTANTAKGHTDHSGSTIYLMDDGAGGAVAHTIAANIAAASGQCFTDIRRDPAAVGAVSIALNATRNMPNYVRFMVDIAHSAGNGFDGFGSPAHRAIAFEAATLNGAGATVPLNYRTPICFLRNLTLTGFSNNANPLRMFANNALTQNVLVLGVICDSNADIIMTSYTVIGCTFGRVQYEEMTNDLRPSFPPQNGCIIANNLFLNIRDTGRRGICKDRLLTRGFAVVQNVWESARTGTSGPVWEVSADSTRQPFDNIVFMHNSFPQTGDPGRFNNSYTDHDVTVGVLKELHFRYNLWRGAWNCKSDTFADATATLTGRTGNWSIRYGVGQEGNVIGVSSDGATGPNQGGGSWLGEWWNPSNRIGGLTVTFVDDRTGAGGGKGNYALTGATNDA